MKIHSIKEYSQNYIAKEDIKRGDILKIIHKKVIRKARKSDVKLLGFSMEDYKKGEIVENITDRAEIESITKL